MKLFPLRKGSEFTILVPVPKIEVTSPNLRVFKASSGIWLEREEGKKSSQPALAFGSVFATFAEPYWGLSEGWVP